MVPPAATASPLGGLDETCIPLESVGIWLDGMAFGPEPTHMRVAWQPRRGRRSRVRLPLDRRDDRTELPEQVIIDPWANHE